MGQLTRRIAQFWKRTLSWWGRGFANLGKQLQGIFKVRPKMTWPKFKNPLKLFARKAKVPPVNTSPSMHTLRDDALYQTPPAKIATDHYVSPYSTRPADKPSRARIPWPVFAKFRQLPQVLKYFPIKNVPPVVTVKPFTPEYIAKTETAQQKQIDVQIIALERSTKVTFKALCTLHNYLRAKYAWYYKWHVYKYSNRIHLTVLSLFVLGTITTIAGMFFLTNVPKSQASNATATLNGAATITSSGSTVEAIYNAFSSNAGTITVPSTVNGAGGTLTINPGDSAATVQTNLQKIASVGTNNATVTGGNPYVYVANSGSNNVSVIDASKNTVAATVTVGSSPQGAVATPDSQHVYVVNNGSSSVSSISTATNTVTATIAVGSGPRVAAITPNGSYLYVANSGSNSVSAISTATNTVVATINVNSNPQGIAVAPGGTYVYVTNWDSQNVSVISTATNTVTATISIGNSNYAPSGVVFTPNGAYAYVSNCISNGYAAGTVSVISTATKTIVATINVGAADYQLAMSNNGSTVYVANRNDGTVSIISTATNTVTSTMSVGNGGPDNLAITPDGNTIYASEYWNSAVTFINTTTNTVTGTINVGTNPGYGVAIAPLVYMNYTVTFNGTLTGQSVAQMTTSTTGWSTAILSLPDQIYFNDSGHGADVTINNFTRQLSGYGWGTSLGLIEFGSGSDNPLGPVSVDPTGHFSGFAKVVGGSYIDFNASPHGSNVTIGTGGALAGNAWSDDAGWVSFSGVTAPNYAPILNVAPTIGATAVSPTPQLQFTAPLGASQFKISLDTVNTFNSANLQTFDETASQTGWTGQNASGNTAYNAGTTASYQTSTPLMQNTTYYWQVATYQGGTLIGTSDTWNFVTKPAGKIIFTTGTQNMTAGTPVLMTLQLQTASSQPIDASANTTVALTSTSGVGRFDTSSGGAFNGTITSVSLPAGSTTVNFYYKDTLVGTPTINVAESPTQGWTDPSQQETVTPASVSYFALSQYPKASANQWAVSSTPWDSTTGAGPAAPYNPLVMVKDAYGNTVTNFNGSVWFGVGEGYTSNLTYFDQPDSYQFTTGAGMDNGQHQFAGADFTVDTAGNAVPFYVETGGTTSTFTIIIKPAVLGQLAVSFGQDTAGIGAPLASPANDVTVTAYDVVGNVKTDYSGSAYFTSSDPNAVLPYTASNPYVFQSNDNGVHTFPGSGFTFNSSGNQTITVYDISTNISSNPADITLSAHPPTNLEATAGDTQVTLSWVNTADTAVDGIHIYQSTTSGTLGSVLSYKPTAMAGQAAEYTVSGLTNGTTYYYTLRSVVSGPADNPVIESLNSTQVSAIPVPIAPKNVSGVQNADGTMTIYYNLPYTSTVSVNYYNPSTSRWSQASTLSGDIGPNQAGNNVSPVAHTASWSPATDFPGQYFALTAGFKIEVQVIVAGSTGDGVSSSIRLDTKGPGNLSLVVNSRNSTTANLAINATDDSAPIQMMLCTNALFTGCSYQSYVTSISNFNIGSATTIYAEFIDSYSNTSTTTNVLSGVVQNFELADASTTATSNYRFVLDWSPFTGATQYIIERSTDGTNFSNLITTNKTDYIDADLDQNTVYYYRVEEQDASGDISRPTNVLSAQPGAIPAVTNDPIIQLFDWKQNVGIQAEITWQTDQLSNSFVAYSTENLAPGAATTTASGDAAMMVGLPDQVMKHVITISDLDPSTTYYIKALSQNDINVRGASNILSFTTPAVIMLQVSGMQTSDLTLSSVNLNWTTNKVSTTVLEYGTDTGYGQKIVDNTWNTTHSASLTNLQSGTTYHYKVIATDQDGNVMDSDDYIVSTPAKPVITNVSVSGQTNASVIINWTTNVNTNTNVQFGPDSTYGSQQGKPDATTLHSLTVVGLNAKTTYHFQVSSTDAFNNVATSPDSTFTTTYRSTPPVISNVTSEISIIGDISSSNYQIQDLVSWTTDEPATSLVKYGQGVIGNYDESSAEQDNLDIDHVVILTNLKANTSYSFQIVSKDSSGNVASSTNYTVLTPAKQQSLTSIIVNSLASNFAWVSVVRHRWF